ncbi:hypothetical protein KW801_00695 [Candidatus Saccharibacteria bacterium]|nr:hypothetical protein [Candidatus Saccharibacteria bacterium]
MKRTKSLFSEFRPERYELTLKFANNAGRLEILGNKVGRPSHRITLHQRKLRILKAEITPKGRKHTTVEVDRINHLPSFEQVRLHTKQILYPGTYQINLEYQLPESAASQLRKSSPNRDLLPSIDEPESWAAAKFEIKS